MPLLTKLGYPERNLELNTMTVNLTHLILIALGLFVALIAFFPGIRAGIARWIRVRVGGKVDDSVTPGEKAKDEGEQAIAAQKKALVAAIDLMEKQKENVVTVSATATTSQTTVNKKKDALASAVKDYNDGKELKMSDEQLNDLALKVKTAREAVATAEANLKIAQANAKKAAGSLKSATEKVQKFQENILSNEQKLVLAAVINTQTELDNLTDSIDNVLSEAGKANDTVDRILAEAEARQNLGKDTTAEELERRRKEKEAQEERDRLDGKAPTAQG